MPAARRPSNSTSRPPSRASSAEPDHRNRSFTVTATGIGSLLTYSYTNSASTVPVTAAGMVIFPPTAVESTASLTFTIQNTGTSSATISSINLGAASTIFSLQQMPALPTNLNAGGSLTFSVSFVPNTTGNLTALCWSTASALRFPAPARSRQRCLHTSFRDHPAPSRRPNSRPSG